MQRTTIAFPVKPGAVADVIATMLKSRPDEYRESRARLGMTLERAYHQPTPMGDYVVVHFETEGPVGEAMGKGVASELAIDKDFIRMVDEIHGVDLTAPPQGSPPETIGTWTDPDASGRGRGLALCAPLIPGTEDAGRAFIHEAFETRRDEMTASRRELGQTVESVTLQETPMGPIACVYLEGADPVEGNRGFAGSDSEFNMWFKAQLTMLFPPEVDFSKPVPPVHEIFDSSAAPINM